MKLITKALEERFEKIGDQSQSIDPIFIAKFFNPAGRQTWYATEYDKENNICFGYVTGFDFIEWGYFSIDELETLKLPYGLKIERDLFFQETRSNKFIQDKEQELER
jgi:hypothetical protein